MQRLFSNFADGWPGVGLLLLRLLIGVAMIHFGLESIYRGSPPVSFALSIICVTSGFFLLIGLFTPVTGTVASAVKGGIAIARFCSHSGEPWILVAQATLAASLAMIGPGAWSIDARRFGRKHIDLSDRQD